MSRNTNYTGARYWAISGVGYGRGFTAEEARENHFKAQQWIKVKNTVFKTRAELDQWIRDIPALWLAPEGTTGFVKADRLMWEIDGTYVDATEADLLEPAKA